MCETSRKNIKKEQLLRELPLGIERERKKQRKRGNKKKKRKKGRAVVHLFKGYATATPVALSLTRAVPRNDSRAAWLLGDAAPLPFFLLGPMHRAELTPLGWRWCCSHAHDYILIVDQRLSLVLYTKNRKKRRKNTCTRTSSAQHFTFGPYGVAAEPSKRESRCRLFNKVRISIE